MLLDEEVSWAEHGQLTIFICAIISYPVWSTCPTCHHSYTHFLLIMLLLDHPLLFVFPVLPSVPLLFLIRRFLCLYDYTDSLWQPEIWWMTLSPSFSRCISKPPPWPSPSACLPPCLWGCSTCPRSTSSSSTPSRTFPNESAASRWVLIGMEIVLKSEPGAD